MARWLLLPGGHELVLAPKEIGHAVRRELPVGMRFGGIGLTSDLVDPKSKEALSYTLEVKATERTAIEAARTFAPGLAHTVASHLGAGEGALRVIGDAVTGAVPIVSTLLAASSARKAWNVVHDPKATRATKVLACANAVADAVKVVFPVAGTIASAALVGISAGWSWHELRARAR